MKKQQLRRRLDAVKLRYLDLTDALPHLVAIEGRLHHYGACSTCDLLGQFVDQPGRPPTIHFDKIIEYWSVPEAVQATASEEA